MPEPSLYLHPRDEILQAMERIYRYRMTTTSGGNLSHPRAERRRLDHAGARRQGRPAARRHRAACRAAARSTGMRKPSSELPIHQQIRERAAGTRGHRARASGGAGGLQPGARGPEYAAVPPGVARLRRGRLRALRTAGQRGARRDRRRYVRAGLRLRDPGESRRGDRRRDSLQEAFRRFETLEFTAKTIIKARLLGGEVRFLTRRRDRAGAPPRRAARRVRAGSRRPAHENEIRRRLSEFVRRAYRQRLFISTQGSFSARVDARSFRDHALPGGPRRRWTLEDLVLVRDGRCEAGQAAEPRRAESTQAIYRRHPGDRRDRQRVSR